jgi:hypothetical protein
MMAINRSGGLLKKVHQMLLIEHARERFGGLSPERGQPKKAKRIEP